MNWVIYKDCGKFRATVEPNFYANPMDARAVYKLDDFDRVAEVVDYFREYMVRRGEHIVLDYSAL